MKVYTTMVPLDDGLNEFDTIEYEGGRWLVPEWLDSPAEKWSMPKRIIRVDFLPGGKAPASSGVDYYISDPIPRTLLNGQIPKELEGRVVVIEHPDIRIYIPRGEA
jgi:hypothetical protein